MDGDTTNVGATAAAETATATEPKRRIIITGEIKIPPEATAGSDAELDYRLKVRDAMREATGALQNQFGNDFSLSTKLTSSKGPTGPRGPRKAKAGTTPAPAPGGKRTG